MKLQKTTSPLSSGNSYWFSEVEKSASQTVKTAFAVFFLIIPCPSMGFSVFACKSGLVHCSNMIWLIVLNLLR